jgi:uncharacterized protein YndB with AHSA1/START domain
VPVISRKRTVPAAPERIWTLVSDPEQLTDWWPGVQRVEDASRQAWTTVLLTPKGRTLRADFTLLESDHPRLLRWRQEVEESPFERILEAAVTELELEDAGDGETDVTLTQRLTLRGFSRLGGLQIRMATRRQLEGALEGLGEAASEWGAAR